MSRGITIPGKKHLGARVMADAKINGQPTPEGHPRLPWGGVHAQYLCLNGWEGMAGEGPLWLVISELALKL